MLMSIMDKITRYLLENEAQPKVEFRITDDHTELRIVRAGVTTDTRVKFFWDGKFHIAGEALTARNKGLGMSIAIIDPSDSNASIAERYIRNQKDGIWGLDNAVIYTAKDQNDFYTQLKNVKIDKDPKNEVDDEQLTNEDPIKDSPMGDDSVGDPGADEIKPDVESESEKDEEDESNIKSESSKPKYKFDVLRESSFMSKTTEEFVAERYNKSAAKLKRGGVYVEPNKDGVRIMFESKRFELSNKQITELSKICPSGVTRNDFLISLSSEW